MGELGLNKIFAVLLAIALVVMGLREVSTIVFGGGHHGSHHYETANEWAESNFKGYRINIAETGGSGPIIEEIYDLGMMMLSAEAAKGERSFKGKCASCHTIEQGGANGTGPNLFNTLGAAKQSNAGFSYSGALGNTEGGWSWENMDAWLENPSKYARGTSMAFAGLKRDDERANVLAYLASYSPDAPEMPAPLPAVDVESGDAEEIAGDAAATDDAVINADETDVVPDAVEEAAAEQSEAIAAAETAIENAQNEGSDAIEAAAEAAQEVVENATDE